MHQGHLLETPTEDVLMMIGIGGLLRLSCLAICSLSIGGMITGIMPYLSCAHTNSV